MAQGKAPLTYPSCDGGTRYVIIIIIRRTYVVVTPSRIDGAVAYVSLFATADPSAAATRPDVNGTSNQHHARHPLVVHDDNCVHLDRQLPRFYALSSHPPCLARPQRCRLGRKIAREKKGVFAGLFVSLVILMFCPVYVLSSRSINGNGKKKKYALSR